jgi:hypothetical protein
MPRITFQIACGEEGWRGARRVQVDNEGFDVGSGLMGTAGAGLR